MLDVVEESMIVKPRFDSSTPTASAISPPGAKAMTFTECLIWLAMGRNETFDEAQPPSKTEARSTSTRRFSWSLSSCWRAFKIDYLRFLNFD